MLRAFIDSTIHDIKEEQNGEWTNRTIVMQRPYKDLNGFNQTEVTYVDALGTKPEHVEYRASLQALKGKRVLLPVFVKALLTKKGTAWQVVQLDISRQPQIVKS